MHWLECPGDLTKQIWIYFVISYKKHSLCDTTLNPEKYETMYTKCFSSPEQKQYHWKCNVVKAEKGVKIDTQ